MPIKKVVCCICQKEVNKVQTLAIDEKGNRACRIHDGVQEKSDFLVTGKRKALLRDIEKHKRPKYKYEDRMKEAMVLRCWGCYKEGVHAKDVLFRELIEMEKLALFPENKNLSFFDFQQKAVKASIKHFNGKVPIFIIQGEKSKIHMLDWRCREAARLSHIMSLCPQCCEKMGIEWKKSSNFPDKMDHMVMELSTIALFGELISKEVIRPIAIDEISKNN